MEISKHAAKWLKSHEEIIQEITKYSELRDNEKLYQNFWTVAKSIFKEIYYLYGFIRKERMKVSKLNIQFETLEKCQLKKIEIF